MAVRKAVRGAGRHVTSQEAEALVLDSTSSRSEHGRLGVGETWQWAVPFDEGPEFEVDYYTVEVTASFE